MTPFLKPFSKVSVFISIFGGFSVNERRKRIKKRAFSNENVLVGWGPEFPLAAIQSTSVTTLPLSLPQGNEFRHYKYMGYERIVVEIVQKRSIQENKSRCCLSVFGVSSIVKVSREGGYLWILVKQRFRVVFHVVSFTSLVLSRKYKGLVEYSRVYHEEVLHSYFIPCHRKYSGQQNSCRARWEGWFLHHQVYNGFPIFRLAVFSMLWFK